MLMVSSSMGMLNGVHGNTPDSWPVVPLRLHLMPDVTGLQDGLVAPSSSSDDSNHSSAIRRDGLSASRWQSNSGLSSVLRVADDHAGSS